MGIYLITFFLIVTGGIAVSMLIANRNREDDSYSDLETEEWDCPECGFKVQVGSECIYCGGKKEKK
ncbi:MAG: hypothetical protein HOD97_02585 [Candidatus Marinimicrobia bacterium]|jgi:uncharacterized protein (UPF0212 family)|nr:hypothetical protein [Candidatus Neomarinimicrobiota bacterium]MBT3617251.1 hypothetical protein [Candidatus Neomarinimicrobiota bacterium]MBT3828814.1 hypothetical protein [Candidatus Neomarinimicrobiota bacterium]MBT3997785.1 hypothetical protein [Candidatus Neomarinimicrobiota bacterium]MBT4280499.1 hypothetical protein [Candidatus Neomarinimicrobiota bacterium]